MILKAFLKCFVAFPLFSLQISQALATQTYVCGYGNDANSIYRKNDVVITVDAETAVAVACAPVSSAIQMQFRVIEDNPADIVFSAGSMPGLGNGATSVFGLDRRTGRLYHCVNRFRVSGNPVWIATCFQAGKRQMISESESNS